MRKGERLLTAKSKSLILACALLFCKSNFAAIPASAADIGSVQPGRINKQVLPSQPMAPGVAAPLQAPQAQPNPLGAEASKLKFKLVEIILEGNHVYPEAKLLPLYKDKLGKTISVAELQDIVQSITNFYRNNGYILSRAILPPQHVRNGIVRVRVLEGYLGALKVLGHPKGARPIVTALGNNIVASKPLQLEVMERNLRIMNELPGVVVKAVLEPSKTKQAASDLDLSTDARTFSGFFSYDDYGTRYIGPQQFTLGGEWDSIFRSGDATRATYVTTTRPKELKFYDLVYDTPLWSDGLRVALDGNYAITNPLYVLQGLIVSGNASTYTGTLTYPVIRSRSQNLTLSGMFNYLDSYVDELGQQLYTDHIRSLKFGVSYDFADRHQGSNIILFNLEQGLPFFGATTNSHSFTTSRYGATSRFTKFTVALTRLQALFGRYSAYGTFKGQYSFNPLLSSEQFGFGGPQVGRGYDPAEIIGDRGIEGSLELRADFSPERFMMQSLQFYTFFDAGQTYNKRNVTQGIDPVLSAISAGAGVRFGFTKYLSGNLMVAQPLTREVQSLQLIGNGRRARSFFSLTASV